MVAIVDNSFLVRALSVTNVNLIVKLRSIFEYLLFPEKVIEEFSPTMDLPENVRRNAILEQIRISEGFFRLCTSKDLIILNEIRNIPKVDAGEAEAIAQSLVRAIPIIIMDDKQALKHLPEKFSHLRFYNTLTLIAMLDILEYINNYEDCIRELFHSAKFKSKELRFAYQQAAQHFSVNLSPKTLSAKSSLSKIL